VFKPSAAHTRARAPLAAAHDALGCAAREWKGGRLRAIDCTAHHHRTIGNAVRARSKRGRVATGDGEARLGEGRRDVVLARVGLGLPAPANSEVRRNTLRQTIGAARLRERAANE
jgi:hypothetical protein